MSLLMGSQALQLYDKADPETSPSDLAIKLWFPRASSQGAMPRSHPRKPEGSSLDEPSFAGVAALGRGLWAENIAMWDEFWVLFRSSKAIFSKLDLRI